MTNDQRQVTIIGAGVMGLSCGVRLLEAGWQVEVVTRDMPAETVSAVAAAVWYPYKAYPADKVLGWGAIAYNEFVRLHQTDPAAGILMVPVEEPLPTAAPDPWWRSAVPDFHRLPADRLPEGFVDGYAFTAPVIDMSLYLEYLLSRYRALGGTITQRPLANLAEVQQGQPIVNCAGLGARELVGDEALFPIRGQIVLVKAPQIQRCRMDDHGRYQICYIIPRQNDVVIGGVAQEGNWDMAVDEATAAEIIRKAQAFEPALADMEIVAHKVGLRPGRAAIRLEREETAAGPVIHNYGHGGAGVTLSWGCAAEVAALVGNAE
ncbi:MAG: FAD-dependent oxidoreductase [Chloroflexi bacterium]|nr:FAD-dependent oxidoreductase [Chloroflexota bacterium]